MNGATARALDYLASKSNNSCLQVVALLPLLLQVHGKTEAGAPLLFAFWALAAPVFSGQAVMA